MIRDALYALGARIAEIAPSDAAIAVAVLACFALMWAARRELP